MDYLGHNPETDQVELGGLDDIFTKKVPASALSRLKLPLSSSSTTSCELLSQLSTCSG